MFKRNSRSTSMSLSTQFPVLHTRWWIELTCLQVTASTSVEKVESAPVKRDEDESVMRLRGGCTSGSRVSGVRTDNDISQWDPS